jgi:hypothetical protein
MAKILKADCSGADAYVDKTITFPGSPSDIYISFRVFVPAATLANLRTASAAASATFIDLQPLDGCFLGDNSSTATLISPATFGTNYEASPSGVPGAFSQDAWHTVTVHINPAGDWAWALDGTPMMTNTIGTCPTGSQIIHFGGWSAYDVTGEVYYLDDIKVGSTLGGTEYFSDNFESGNLSAWDSASGAVSVVDDPTPPPVVGGFMVALTNGPLDDPVSWTRLDNHDGVLVESISISRGRADERSKTSPGTVMITGIDKKGDLDPTNTSSPFYPNLQPVKQAAIQLYNPTNATWNYLFRGYIDTLEFTLNQREEWLEFTITLIDMLDMLNDAEITPDNAGNTVPSESTGDCYYTGQAVDDRILAVLADASTAFMAQIWPTSLLQIASGNVDVQGRVYANRTSLLQVIDEAVDAEFPGATNRFITATGAFAFRGRFYRFTPSLEIPADNTTRVPGHEMLHWFVGDLAAYRSDSTLAVPTELKFQLGKTNLINIALVTPIGITDAQLASGTQFYSDATSINNFGPRTSGMSLENLCNAGSNTEPNNDLQETATFADATVQNYKDPVIFVSELTFRNPAAGDATLEQNVWKLLCNIELSDLLTATSTHPGGGGFTAEDHYVESIKYQIVPLQGDVWDVTLTAGLSSRQHFTYMPPSWNLPGT